MSEDARPVIVGVDGRSGGEDAMALADPFAARLGRELIVVSARSDSPAEELISAALEHDASAIVIGSSHRGSFGRVLPGTVGSRLLRGSPCSLILAPAGFARDLRNEIKSIGVAYDGSREAKLALGEGIAVARAFGARLRLLAVLDEPELVGAGWAGVAPLTVVDDEARALHREQVERDLAAAIETIPVDVDADAEALEGRPAPALAAASRRLGLLVLGSRSYGPVRRVLIGGVSGPLTRAASCPLLLVPRSAAVSSAAAADAGMTLPS